MADPRARVYSPGAPSDWLLPCLVALMMVFGGGGSPAPLSELVCEVLAAAVLALWLWSRPTAPSRAVIAVALLIALPVAFQLVPLPPSLWLALPGREAAAEGLRLAGNEGWHALSLAPHRTFAALLALGPPLLALALAAASAPRARHRLAWAIAATALASVVIGALQLAQGGTGPFDFYAVRDASGVLHGFQANRNTQALVLLVGLLALAWGWARGRGPVLAYVAAATLLVLGVIFTGSRAGMALALVAAGCCFAIVRPARSPVGPRRVALILAAFIAFTTLGLWLLSDNPAVARIFARFALVGEFRPELWRDTWFAIGQYWPAGSGVGTYIPAFLPAERLEVVDATLPHRAHNELLELALEGGLPLLLAWLGASVIVGTALWRRLRAGDVAARFAAGVLALGALHSLVDYPFRSVAMATLIATAAGIALSPRGAGSEGRGGQMTDHRR